MITCKMCSSLLPKKHKLYCSKKCMAKDYKVRFVGKNSYMYGKKNPSLKKYQWHKLGLPHPFLGKHHTEEAKKKISVKAKERLKDKRNHPLFNKRHSKETKRKISIAHKGRKPTKDMLEHLKRIGFKKGNKNWLKTIKNLFKKGEGNISWQGGKSFEPYGIDFNKKLKELIRRRDHYRCQECHYTEEQLGYKLSIHHIDFNKKNNNNNNLISLCRSCHSQTNFNRQDWINHFKKT